MLNKIILRVAAGVGLLSWIPTVWGQADGQLERIVVRDIPIEENVVPTSRPYSSVYGMDLNVMDTPRNVTIISQAQLEAISVTDPRDFSKLTSSSYTDASFGNPNVPRIRGEYADLYINGMRNSFTVNGNGFPLSFNSVESLNITKGPASIIYGAGPGVGGSIDLITKRPYFDRFRGDASATFDTESKRKWNVDIGAPIIKDQLAYRFSYTGEESDSFYLNQFFRQHSVYGAITWTPNDRYTLEVNTEGVVANYTENVGINRVNQGLIDNGTYLTGTPTQTILANFFSGGLVPPFPVGVP
ncbi:MAG: TonB-dependent receptor plug domain-containing protein, partial [Verrucomicrobiia bacterium]